MSELQNARGIVKVHGVWAEYLFEWFNFAVNEPCGDGAAVICCGNPKETADEFIKFLSNKNMKMYHPRDETNNNGHIIVNYHDSNENFMFSNKVIDLGFGDISFVIESDLKNFQGDVVVRRV